VDRKKILCRRLGWEGKSAVVVNTVLMGGFEVDRIFTGFLFGGVGKKKDPRKKAG